MIEHILFINLSPPHSSEQSKAKEKCERKKKREKKEKMILTLIGLILSFIGSAYLVYDTLMSFGKPKSATSIIYDKGRIKEVIRYKHQEGGWLKQVKITPEEIKLIISLSLLSLGFLFQILDFIPKEFWSKLFN